MPKYKFKLLHGRHAYNSGTDQNPKLVRFSQGDIIETDTPLDEIYNSPGAIKFERLAHNVPDTEETLLKQQADLERRLKELREKAAAESEPSREPAKNQQTGKKPVAV